MSNREHWKYKTCWEKAPSEVTEFLRKRYFLTQITRLHDWSLLLGIWKHTHFVQQGPFFLSLFFCNFDDQLSEMFTDLLFGWICWDKQYHRCPVPLIDPNSWCGNYITCTWQMLCMRQSSPIPYGPFEADCVIIKPMLSAFNVSCKVFIASEPGVIANTQTL